MRHQATIVSMRSIFVIYFKSFIKYLLLQLFGLFPVSNNKIVATTMKGRKYGDNPQFIVEYIKKVLPQVDVVWLTAKGYEYTVPVWIRKIPYTFNLKMLYEMRTAKVWIDSHRLKSFVKKKNGQYFIETWHGGLGMKKIEMDTEAVRKSQEQMSELKNTCKLADVFISNSDHLSNIYRKAFGYQGPIWKCGYPKNDILLKDHSQIANNTRKDLNIINNTKIVLYAPTYRDGFAWRNEKDFSVFDINYEDLKKAVQERFGGDWTILVKWHPTMIPYIQRNHIYFDNVTDVTEYNNMQGLICAADIVISDYSSCIFDAALREIPCFTYAKDFEEYKKTQGTYFEMEELPFPYAKNNEELIYNISHYNHNSFLKRWDEFKTKTGLVETGHATKEIAEMIIKILDGKKDNIVQGLTN